MFETFTQKKMKRFPQSLLCGCCVCPKVTKNDGVESFDK